MQNEEDKENESNHVNNIVPEQKFILTPRDALITGLLLKLAAYAILIRVDWRLAIAFFIYGWSKSIFLRLGIF